MPDTCYAAIDIGSNAVRLLIKRVKSDEAQMSKKFSKVLMLRVPLRLGFDVFSLGELSDGKSKKLLRLMKAFRQLMKIYEVTDYRACATSAMREAANGKDVIKKIQKATGLDIEIIGGQEEAQLIYKYHIECSAERLGNYIYVDVGGGSTEINLQIDGELKQSLSYNIGTVRMLRNVVEEGVWERMKDDLSHLTEGLDRVDIIGSGGNINRLYRLASKKDKKKQRMSVGSLKAIYDQLSLLTPGERMDAFNIKADRADVIVPAAEIFLAIAEVVRAEYIHVPVIGLADGMIDGLYEKHSQEQNAAIIV
ncbi:Ppx/GppA family phosphatase [uncultured Bacteroides sp.]|uniref:Ppx/GppA phosphatase family protein n=1 Tax=uncultured Bacteroides sp. TaxID=162156 RepID=UPI002AA77BDA|nr:Ppx/GppA family phosphatase [uncultured Bacteroides sp.]